MRQWEERNQGTLVARLEVTHGRSRAWNTASATKPSASCYRHPTASAAMTATVVFTTVTEVTTAVACSQKQPKSSGRIQPVGNHLKATSPPRFTQSKSPPPSSSGSPSCFGVTGRGHKASPLFQPHSPRGYCFFPDEKGTARAAFSVHAVFAPERPMRDMLTVYCVNLDLGWLLLDALISYARQGKFIQLTLGLMREVNEVISLIRLS